MADAADKWPIDFRRFRRVPMELNSLEEFKRMNHAHKTHQLITAFYKFIKKHVDIFSSICSSFKLSRLNFLTSLR